MHDNEIKKKKKIQYSLLQLPAQGDCQLVKTESTMDVSYTVVIIFLTTSQEILLVLRLCSNSTHFLMGNLKEAL